MDGLIFDTEKFVYGNSGSYIRKIRLINKEKKINVKTLGIAGETLKRTLYDIYGSDYPDEIISNETRKQVNYIIEKTESD